jgi:flagellar biogenesis protein FliO
MDAFEHLKATVQVSGSNARAKGGSWAYHCRLIVLIAAASWLTATFAVADGPPSDSQAQRATYQSLMDRTPAVNTAARSNDPMPIASAGRDSSDPGGTHAAHRETPAIPSAGPAVLSMFGSLAVVIGLFLGLVWLLRRGSPKSIRLLSSDVVELLGRSPLAGRQQMHVIRFGNRLLLVAISPDGAETLAEISDPPEVERLAGLCQQTHPASATQAFRQIFGQLGELRRPSRLDESVSIEGSSRSSANAANHGASPLGSRTSLGSSATGDDDV